MDAAGNVYIAGDTLSGEFPTTPGVYQRTHGSRPAGPDFSQETNPTPDQFVAKFDPSLSRLLFSTLAGTSVREMTSDLALGPDGSLYLAGTRGAPRGTGPGATSAIFTRLTPDATAALYAVELGGEPEGGPVVVDLEGNAYFASSNPRWTVGGPGSVTWKLDPSGRPVRERRMPANVTSLGLNGRGELIVAGFAQDLTLPPTPGAPRPCVSYTAARPVANFVSRWNVVTAAVQYTGYLNGSRRLGPWVVGPDRILAEIAYVGLAPFPIVPAGDPPAGIVTCVANAAGFDNTAIAPGEILSIFGTRIGPDREFTAERDADGRVKKELGGTSVTVDGIPAAILYAGAGQINLVAPFAMTARGNVPVEIRRNGVLVAAFEYAAAETNAGLFTVDGSRYGPLAALNQNGSVNSLSNPAPLGSIVTVFASGLGVMIPAAIDGDVPQTAVSIPAANSTLRVSGVGQDLKPEIHYFGNAPGVVQGAVQINFRIPETIVPREGLLGVGGFTNGGTIAVR